MSKIRNFGCLLRSLHNLKPQRYSSTCSKLVYSAHGDPMKVVCLESEPLREPQTDEVLVKLLAAPVNPADINTIQGKYPVKTVLPSVPGNEGVAEVISVGSNVEEFKKGDRVIPFVNALGTWRTHLLASKNNLLKVPDNLGIVEAATLMVNPCTAFRMLRDFVNLKPGDTVIQNGANSACGQNVIQICRTWGLRSVNVIRDRPEIKELKAFLTQLGADCVLTEEELRKTDVFKTGKVEKPKLALNCVGGPNALEILRHLQKGGTMVTYGGMSREPVTVPTSALIFKDVRIRGFWMTQWSQENADNVDRFEMFEELIAMIMSNELQGPACKMIRFEDYKEALLNTITVKGMIGKKYILDFQ